MIPMEASIHDVTTPEVVCFDETMIICYDKVEKHLLELSEYFLSCSQGRGRICIA